MLLAVVILVLQRVKEMYKLLCGVCHHCLQAINWIKKDE